MRTPMHRLQCEACEYVARVSGACLARGLPACPCGAGKLRPTDPVDLVELGLLELDELPRRARTALCKANGWEDEIVRTSPAQMPGSRRLRVRTLTRLPF